MQQGKRVFTICARGSQQDLTTNGWNRTCSFRIAVTTLMVNEYLHQADTSYKHLTKLLSVHTHTYTRRNTDTLTHKNLAFADTRDFRMKLPLGFWNEITLLIATPDNWGKVDCMQKYVTKVLQVQKLVTLTKRSKEL
jgi:hypothetical protein